MSTDEHQCDCKVGRNIEQYDLFGLNEELLARHEDGESLRSLEAFVNKRILRAAVERAGGDISTIVSSDRGVDALYEVLKGEGGTTPTEQARVSTRLEQAGVDIDSVENDWISHATIRSHLNDCLDVDTSRDTTITQSDAINTVEWARTRCENVVAETVERLRNADEVSITAPEVSASVRIACDECGRSYMLRSLLEEGGCDCHVEE